MNYVSIISDSDNSWWRKDRLSTRVWKQWRMQKHVNYITCHFINIKYTQICGNKMPTRCNGGFYCRSYCLLNMFRAPLCPSSGAQEYYTGGCCLWYFMLWFSSCWSGGELRVMCPVCRMLQHPANRTSNLKTTAWNTTGSNHLYNTLELLMMGIVVPETCWASNKICNKNLRCNYVAFYFHILMTMHGQKSHQI